jgi:hypothetical protein
VQRLLAIAPTNLQLRCTASKHKLQHKQGPYSCEGRVRPRSGCAARTQGRHALSLSCLPRLGSIACVAIIAGITYVFTLKFGAGVATVREGARVARVARVDFVILSIDVFSRIVTLTGVDRATFVCKLAHRGVFCCRQCVTVPATNASAPSTSY